MTSCLVSRSVRILPRLLHVASRGTVRSFLPVSGTCLRPSPLTVSCPQLSTQVQQTRAGEGWVKKPLTKSKEEERLDKMLYSMDLSIRKKGRIMISELHKVVALVESLQYCSPTQAVLLFKCCGEVLVDEDKQARTRLLEKSLRLVKNINGMNLDISHYNTLLKVHLENGNLVNIAEFMASLEQKNIQPNRVTFQHCVSHYCRAGDVVGATTILHHMKENDMAINDSVLLSLLSAHCVNNDPDSVSSTLDVISGSGIMIGAEVYTIMAESYARSGNWEKVQETLKEAADKGIKFDDSDIFSIIQGCTDGNLIAESFSLIEKFPKRRGYFQELRIAVPQLALAGNIDVVMHLATTQKDRPGFDKTNQGLFLTSSITRSGAPVDKIVPAILQLEDSGYKMSFQYMFQDAAYYCTPERCREFLEEVQKMKAERKEAMLDFSLESIFKYLRYRLEHDENIEQIFQCLNNLQVMNLPVPYNFISYDIIPEMLRRNFIKPRETVLEINRCLPELSYSMICNSMLQFLLNQQTQQHFDAAVGFFLHSNIDARPHRWNSSLARSYLSTRDVENMVTIIHCGIKKAGEEEDMSLKQLFHSLEFVVRQAHLIQPGVPPDDLIAPILQDLIRHKIGFPSKVESFSLLQESLKSQQVIDLLTEAAKVWDDNLDTWTEANREQFHETRKVLFNKKMRVSRRLGQVNINVSQEVLDDPTELEKKYIEMKNSGNVSFKVCDKLIHHFLEQDRTDKAVEILNYCREGGKSFCLSPTTSAAFVEAFLRQQKLEEAKKLMLDELSAAPDRKLLCGPLMKCLAAMAADGDHEEVMKLLENIDKKRVLERGTNVNLLQRVYVEKRDMEKLVAVTEYLFSHQLADPGDSSHFNPFIDLYLEDGDLAGALEEFTRVATVYGKLPSKFKLTCKLIELEDAAGIQRVVDVSSKRLPYLRAVYDLAHCFLHMGDKSKAKQLFDSPGLKYDQERIDYIYKQLELFKPEACHDLVMVTRNLHGCDRDLLFQKLVKTIRADPDKVEDVWLTVQEEGFIPSHELKLSIADTLESHGRTAPFVRPDPVVREDLSKTGVDKTIYSAIKQKDNHKAVGIFLKENKNQTTSLKCRKNLLEHLIQDNDLSRAKIVATKVAHGFKDPVKSIDFRHMYYNLMELLGEKESEDFLNSLPKRLAAVLKEKRKPLKNSNEPALEALKSNDIETVKELVSQEKVNHTMLRRIMSSLINDGKLDEASDVALIFSKCENLQNVDQLSSLVKLLLKKWEELGDLEKIREFLENLGRKCHQNIRGDVILRNAVIGRDPAKYLELLKEDSAMQHIVSEGVLKKAVSENPEFLNKLESSAATGNIPATVLMAKYHLSLENASEFAKFYQSCPQDLMPKKLFDEIDTEEKFKICLKEASSNKAYLEQIINRYLRRNSRDHKEFARIANIGVEKGMELSGFAGAWLEKLSKNSEFSLQKEALERASS